MGEQKVQPKANKVKQPQASKGQAQNQNQKKNPKSQQQPVIPNKDLFHRVNFSYQAAIFLQNLGEGSGSGSNTTFNGDEEVRVNRDRKGKRKAVEVEGDDRSTGPKEEGRAKAFRKLARIGMKEMKGMSVHNQLKLDPTLKRSICRTCSTVLIPGLTSRMRNRPSRSTITKSNSTCLTCSTTLSIPTPPVAQLASTGTERLDGPVRAAKRRKAMKRSKVSFDESEMGVDSGTAVDEKRGGKGHIMWKGEEKIIGWGVVPSTDSSGSGSVETKADLPQGVK
ncbi:hypothetical protein CI109_100825 [Kwoniella shandongensis]|uniref:Uncharacterized protein n=1 Tax=Kwoniella shandongensis TaxID=1734106 RepID=A0AAJ8LEK7_9TREE